MTRNVVREVSKGEHEHKVSDYGLRRYLSFGMEFDFRANTLSMEIKEEWNEDAKALHHKNKENLIQRIFHEYGSMSSTEKLANFSDIGAKPMSVVSYHSTMFEQVRKAFVMGAYYPALVGACALGERILNHLILDLREYFRETNEHKRVREKKSFDDWEVSVNSLEAWGVLLPEAAKEFRQLRPLRHKSIHFNMATYANLRTDALQAIRHLKSIIDHQFSSIAVRPWFITGTVGQVFIRRSFENNPFVRTYFLPQCPLVGPLFCLRPGEKGWQIFDLADYGTGICSDEEFAETYNKSNPAMVVNPL